MWLLKVEQDKDKCLEAGQRTEYQSSTAGVNSGISLHNGQDIDLNCLEHHGEAGERDLMASNIKL